MAKNSTFLIGLAAAAAAGAALGLLMAPKKGSETRKDISDKIDEIYDHLKSVGRKVKSHASNMQDDLYDLRNQAKV
ncbi:YtxH domain-containing protein [Dinghuibacter silviterrae]|uniref:YtxH-like protein n=1 Tax=Dinghuibacter silviterrae TaxID=1539049 RepID=A0A4R8DQX5_9BACT|nr:YtxH domain-containing protein [Dinghuibacter silviterrae]TDX00560.1 YtxH-like protein [Dinghuibacter silviterrae]